MSESERAKTSAALLAQIFAFLPPDEIQDLAKQVGEHLPSSLSTFANHGFPTSDESAASTRPLSSEFAPPECGEIPAMTVEQTQCLVMGAKLAALQEAYPLRAAALSLRILLYVLARLLEEGKLSAVSDDAMPLLIDVLLRTEAVIEGRCLNCPICDVVRQ